MFNDKPFNEKDYKDKQYHYVLLQILDHKSSLEKECNFYTQFFLRSLPSGKKWNEDFGLLSTCKILTYPKKRKDFIFIM